MECCLLILYNLFFNKRGVSSLNVIIIILIFALLGLSSYTVVLFSDLLDIDTIYKGIYVNNINVGGMTKEELRQILIDNEKKVLEEKFILVRYNEKQKEIKYTDIGINVNIDETVDKVWNTGRTGDTKDRVFEIISTYLHPRKYYTEVTYDDILVERLITQIYDDIYVERVDNSYEINNDKLILKSGTDGKELNRTVLANQIYGSLEKLESAEYNAEISVYPRRNIDINEIIETIYLKEEPASFRVENNQVEIIPEKNGRTIDKTVLEKSAADMMIKENLIIPLTIQTVIPDFKVRDIEENLFKDSLAVRTTTFSTYDKNTINRGINIKLASQAVNGKVLAPGEIFSFNQVVGERSAARGYQTANIYTSGQIVEGIGGGICQISSLLYNIALYSGLEIVERVNHQFTVSYVELGTDATVSFGSIDFRFKNNTDWPIKIVCDIKDNSVEINFIGTDEHPGRNIAVETKVIQEYPFNTIEQMVTTLAPGQKSVKQEGMTGYYVTAYRVFKTGDDVVREELGKSWYSKRDKIVLVGTE